MSPQPRIVNLDGVKHTFPPDATDDEIRQALGGANSSVSRETVPGMEQLGGTPPKPPVAPFAPGGSAVPDELKPEDQQDQSFWTSPKGLIRTGLAKAGKGVAALTRPGVNAKLDAGMDIAEGLGQAAIPAVLPVAAQGAIAAGVIPTVTSLAGGAALGMGGEKAAEALGAPSWLSRATGAAGAVVGGSLGSKVPAHPLKVDPRVTATKALRPTPTNPGFSENIPETMKRVLQANQGENPTGFNKGTFDLIPAAQKAANIYKEALEPWFQRAEGVVGSGDPIVEATAKAASGMLPSERGAAANLVHKAAQDFGGSKSPRELQGILELLNKRLRSYYNGSPASQAAALADYPEAMVVAQRDAAADTLYKLLDPEAEGANVRAIQLGRSHALDIMEDASRRNNAILAEQPSSPMEKILDPIKRALHLRGGPGAGISFATGNEGRTVPLLNRTFNAVKGEEVNALPKPPTEFYPPTPDWQQIPESRQLGPGRAPFTQGTSVPDVKGRPDLRRGYNAGLLESGPQPQVGGPHEMGPIPEDPSFVRSVQGMNQPPNPARAITQGDIIPPSDFSEPVFGPVQGHYPNAPNPRRALPPASTIISPKYPPPDASAGVGATPPTQLPPASEGSFVRGVKAPINPKTGKPWTAEEIKTYLAALPKYARGGIIRTPTLLSDLKTGKPTGIMAEEGPEEIKPLNTGEMDDLSSQLDELTGRKRRAVLIPSGTFPRPIPDGMAVHVDNSTGNKIAFNPNLIGIHDIKTAVAMKRLSPILGRTHSPSAMSSLTHIMKQSRKLTRTKI